MAFMQLANMSLKEQFERIRITQKRTKAEYREFVSFIKSTPINLLQNQKKPGEPRYDTLQKLIGALNTNGQA